MNGCNNPMIASSCRWGKSPIRQPAHCQHTIRPMAVCWIPFRQRSRTAPCWRNSRRHEAAKKKTEIALESAWLPWRPSASRGCRSLTATARLERLQYQYGGYPPLATASLWPSISPARKPNTRKQKETRLLKTMHPLALCVGDTRKSDHP
jgi:hypothetical protein